MAHRNHYVRILESGTILVSVLWLLFWGVSITLHHKHSVFFKGTSAHGTKSRWKLDSKK